MNWSWSDAWLLTAAYFTQENPVSLRGVIGAGDGINHAIFTDDELDHGMTRLTAAGLARLEGPPGCESVSFTIPELQRVRILSVARS